MKCRKDLNEKKSEGSTHPVTNLEETCLPSKSSPALRWHDCHTGFCAELGNHSPYDKGKVQVGTTHKGESTDDGEWGGILRNSDDASVMGAERREDVILAVSMGKLARMGETPLVGRRHL